MGSVVLSLVALTYLLGAAATSTIVHQRTVACPRTPIDDTSLTNNTKLPNPFKFLNGSTVSTHAGWACRRAEIRDLFQYFEFGDLPGRPDSVTGSVVSTSEVSATLLVKVAHQGRSIEFNASIRYPSTSTDDEAPAGEVFPAIISLGPHSIPVPPGVAAIVFKNDEIAEQSLGMGGSRGRGKFYDIYGRNHSAGAFIAYTWAIGRIIDVLEDLPLPLGGFASPSRIDPRRLAVTGCSRNAKAVLAIGAFEERIALTVPQEAGTSAGGTACWRIANRALPRNGVHPAPWTPLDYVRESVWFARAFNVYATSFDRLPFDHHFLAALVAPRGLLVLDHSGGMDWQAAPQAVWGCMVTARKVFRALGVQAHMGVSQVGGHEHCEFPSSQRRELELFVDGFLRGDVKGVEQDVQRTDAKNNAGFVEAAWVDWVSPVVVPS